MKVNVENHEPYSVLFILEQETTLNDKDEKEVKQPLTDNDLTEFYTRLQRLCNEYGLLVDSYGETNAMKTRIVNKAFEIQK